MRTAWMVTAAFLLGGASAARAESCADKHQTCLENCHIDHGMDDDRKDLLRCVKRCGTRHEDCRDLKKEEGKNQRREEREYRPVEEPAPEPELPPEPPEPDEDPRPPAE